MAAVFFISFVYTVLYWWILSRGLASVQNPSDDAPKRYGVSVVVTSRNHLDQLKKNIPQIIAQEGVDFELVLVDDQSEDGSLQWMQKLREEHPKCAIQIIRHEKYTPGKKGALADGIASARYDRVLLTDADCVPASKHWIKTMNRYMTEGTDVVIGYSPIKKEKGVLNLFQRWDHFFVGVQYLAWAAMGRPYMAVGRNLMYRKDLLSQADGFRGHQQVPGGDDDLFIQQIAGSATMRICLDPSSFVFTKGKSTWWDLVLQKNRHVSTSPLYRKLDIALLALYPLALFSFYSTALLLLFCVPTLVLGIYLLRMAMIEFLLKKPLRMLGASELLYRFWLLDALQLVYYSVVSLNSFFYKTTRW